MKISREELNYTTDLLDIIEYCRFSHYCLWDERKRLPLIFKKADPYDCLKGDCPVIIFRKKFESESPNFYAAALNMSRTKNAIVNALRALEFKQGSARQRRRRFLRRLDETKTFDHLIVLAIYPLSLKVDAIPNLNQKEIEGLLQKYNSSMEERLRNMKRMAEINNEWVYWLDDIAYLLSENSQDITLIPFLIYLFLEGLEKKRLPNIRGMSEKEKNEFFTELEKIFFKKEK